MSIVRVFERSKAPLGAAYATQTAGRSHMPLLTELGSRVGVPDCYRHGAPNGAFAPIPGVSLRFER
jgi:hypothetical protein